MPFKMKNRLGYDESDKLTYQILSWQFGVEDQNCSDGRKYIILIPIWWNNFCDLITNSS